MNFSTVGCHGPVTVGDLIAPPPFFQSRVKVHKLEKSTGHTISRTLLCMQQHRGVNVTYWLGLSDLSRKSY